jgi:hypothetical protein
MSKKDLDDATFQFQRSSPPPAFVTPPEQEGEALCFNVQGEWTEDSQKCAAKRVNGVKGPRYFIKWCTDGPDKGHPLNPYSVYFREGDDVRLEAKRGKLRYEFKLVSQSAFSSYLRFLKTKKYTHCQETEREVLNGG